MSGARIFQKGMVDIASAKNAAKFNEGGFRGEVYNTRIATFKKHSEAE